MVLVARIINVMVDKIHVYIMVYILLFIVHDSELAFSSVQYH